MNKKPWNHAFDDHSNSSEAGRLFIHFAAGSFCSKNYSTTITLHIITWETYAVELLYGLEG